MAHLSKTPGRPLITSGFLGLALVLSGCQTLWGPSTDIPRAKVETVPGQLIVKFRAETPSAVRSSLRERYAATNPEGLLANTERWHVTGDVDALRARLRAESALEWVEPNYLRQTLAFTATERTGSANQWYLDADRGIGIQAAWDTLSDTPGAGVTVAVIDTGVDVDHPELTDRIARDGNGAKRFIDEVGNDSSVTTGATNFIGRDGNGHGTHVAGIVGATAGNGGIVGVAPGVTILPVKTMRADGSGDDFAIAKGFKDAADAGAEVINLSVGGAAPSQLLADAIAYGLSQGSTFVMASGNVPGGAPVYYPAAYAGVIAVGATSGSTTTPFAVASYSNRGPELSLVAPGGDGSLTDANRGIYSTVPHYSNFLGKTNYATMSGTSMATPIVSGVAALVIADAKARGERLTPSQVRARLLATVKPLGNKTFSSDWGYGLIDPLKALTWNGPGGTL